MFYRFSLVITFYRLTSFYKFIFNLVHNILERK